jgi:hypothetical protein
MYECKKQEPGVCIMRGIEYAVNKCILDEKCILDDICIVNCTHFSNIM